MKKLIIIAIAAISLVSTSCEKQVTAARVDNVQDTAIITMQMATVVKIINPLTVVWAANARIENPLPNKTTIRFKFDEFNGANNYVATREATVEIREGTSGGLLATPIVTSDIWKGRNIQVLEVYGNPVFYKFILK